MVAIWWTWLGTYSPQLQVIAALAGVAVAALGVWYARRYVRLTRDLARAVRVQAGEARTAAQAVKPIPPSTSSRRAIGPIQHFGYRRM